MLDQNVEYESGLEGFKKCVKCGHTKFEHRDSYYDDCGEVEYNQYCKLCGEYNGYFCYGHFGW